ncbi:hypothetical protein BDA99DRAFT_562357 [Phascolomyces articulosus]|uniref:Uncharacterized protein n=1 Tax=Phascolomyces articulosus TaxID=60185 RepID=A0AAD5PBH2_9FUNG|nr:hypothetical protein BDA99DRAFT_562357 [Phascolomyces articulosus]
MNFYDSPELPAYTLGVNVPPLALSFGVTIAAITAMSTARHEYTRVYWNVLGPAILVMLSCILNIVMDFAYYDNGILSIVTAVFDAAPPIFTWWIIFDLIAILSYPRIQLDNMKATKKQKIMAPITRAILYFIFSILGLGIVTTFLVLFVGFGVAFLNFVTLIYFIVFLIQMKQCHHDVRPLGGSFRLLVGFVVIGNTLGSVVMGILSLMPLAIRTYGSYGSIAFAHNIVSLVAIKYASIFAMITVLYAFPRYWIPHIRGASVQYDMVDSELQQEEPAFYYQYQDGHHYQQQQSQVGHYNHVPSSYPMLEHQDFSRNNSQPSGFN